jgi:hypothetical protein
MWIWAPVLIILTMLLRVGIPILNGDFHVADDGVGSHIGDQLFFIDKQQEHEKEQTELLE